MRKTLNSMLTTCVFLGCFLLPLASLFGAETERSRTLLDKEWRFSRYGPMPDKSERAEPDGLEAADYDDSKWRVNGTPSNIESYKRLNKTDNAEFSDNKIQAK